ncbi:aspartyl/glutamyl-tRNA amidotransferase subunit B [Halothiobacillus diazotrophicus]|uniref:Aspartyl/glutamyl-tRNA(Asn/Gln) amidotransferase subunit B n=1 Tax=Halothiobacillus diazotrophicus TaxID=1860122 RepID=A0A191ZGF9_9GAMM|nr:Asp-tRNA(Asn)/Glu-tRNA(Gln) amidotransferase subunit GatB [Halothiobacillus diazotrophicus]ANJ66971.1 aspartyl/glutamyl-tRNA amidotransferase subunit B [Halothiobacillus diazotrophicus]
MSAHSRWEVVIGLEIHAQLATQSKIFSGASTRFGAEPNAQACAVDLGLPGVLPVLNGEAVHMAALFGLAINAEVALASMFDRKNYFYPDLPKGYQISQLAQPIVSGGQVVITLGEGEDAVQKTIRVTRAHLEEDAGKSLHEDFAGMTGIDLNRAGTPLIEIVSEPDMRSAAEAVAYARKIHAIVQYLGICDGNMQEGSFRVDANVSIRPKGETTLGTRTEIKNVNSFRFLERAILFEIERQIELIEDGGTVQQQTRLYDPDKDETRMMRTKEAADDYRYFPDPDLLPVVIAPETLAAWRDSLPELPDAKADRYQREYGLSAYDAAVLTSSKATAAYFEQTLAGLQGLMAGKSADAKLCANWVTGAIAAQLNKTGLAIDESPVSAESLARLLLRIADNTLSNKLAREVFDAMWAGEGEADAIIDARGLKQITDSSAIEALVDEVLAANPDKVAEYRGGKDKLFGFFVGQAMKAARGKANPQQLNEILQARLGTPGGSE